jgi:hypothetical protein
LSDNDDDDGSNQHKKVKLNENVIDSSYYYRLTNDYSGRQFALDVQNDGRNYALKMAPIADYTGQFWRFIHLGNHVYKLQTRFLKNAYSLDIVNDRNARNDKMPHMAKTGDYTGQRWHLLRLEDGTFRLSNEFTGNNLYLDINVKSTKPVMSINDEDIINAGQHWSFTKIQHI